MSFKKNKLKKSKKNAPERKFTINKKDAVDLDFGDMVGDNKLVSSDRDENTKVVLNTFVGKKNMKIPEKIDMFIRNSIERVSTGDDELRTSFVPWLEDYDVEDMNDFKIIKEAIADSGVVGKFSDEIEANNIKELQ